MANKACAPEGVGGWDYTSESSGKEAFPRRLAQVHPQLQDRAGSREDKPFPFAKKLQAWGVTTHHDPPR